MPFDPKDPETKAALKAAVDSAVTEAVEEAVEEAVGGLKAKNTELLGKLKKAQKDSTIDPADHQALQAELDATEAKLSEATKSLKTATTESDKIKKAYEAESRVAHNLLVDTGLSTALLEAGVKKASYLKAAKAMLAGQVVLTTDGENRTAKVGDKLLSDFVKEWAAGDEGKAFVDAPSNSGGGASGGGGGGAGGADLLKLSPEARLQAINAAGATAK